MTEMSGGKLKDIPQPWERKWPDLEMRRQPRWEQKQPPTEEKRRITLRFSSYVGTSAINATHYTVRIEEENNPIWNTERELWQRAWDDIDCEGRTLREEFTLATRAVQWARIMIDEHFSGEEYDVNWSDLELFAEDYRLTDVQHLYAREGD